MPVHQNEMLSTLDLAAAGGIMIRPREEFDFPAPRSTGFIPPPDGDETGVSALSVETLIKNLDLSMVAGRQTALNADGILGRFEMACYSAGNLFRW